VKTIPHKNVTLSLPEPLLRRFKVYAAQHDRSMSSLMADAIAKLVEQDADYERAKRSFLARIAKAPVRGTGPLITWKREDLYDR
jgi:metal-responsive CopG/Arc/MetJ family transcriptional regulator